MWEVWLLVYVRVGGTRDRQLLVMNEGTPGEALFVFIPPGLLFLFLKHNKFNLFCFFHENSALFWIILKR